MKRLIFAISLLLIMCPVFALPGVSTVGEGASGFNVRGESVGQNLILLDEALWCNSSHPCKSVHWFDVNVLYSN